MTTRRTATGRKAGASGSSVEGAEAGSTRARRRPSAKQAVGDTPRHRRQDPATKHASALLIVDFINALEFEGGEKLRRRAEAAARRTAALKKRAVAAGWPVIYANDNFGRWRSDFAGLVEDCATGRSRGTLLARLLAPAGDDLSVLKPRHSAFYGTPLEFLLEELGIRRLAIVGLVTEMCVLFTAHDAYLRKFAVWVPADCVASIDPRVQASTLDHLSRVLSIDVRPSDEGDLDHEPGARTNAKRGRARDRA